MIPQIRTVVGVGCLSLLAACASGNNPADTTGDPNVTAPAPTSDPGTRYLGTDDPIGAIPVETPPVDGTWTGGQTSIARPVGGGAASGSPDGGSMRPAQPLPASGDLPQPNVRSGTTPPPPPPLR